MLRRSLATAALLMAMVAPVRAQVDDGAVAAMDAFLAAWEAGDERAAMAHFSVHTSAVALAPRGVVGLDYDERQELLRADERVPQPMANAVRSGYWEIINRAWAPERGTRAEGNRAERFVRVELEADVVDREHYLAFEATRAWHVHSFDEISGYVWRVLDGGPIVVMIADFENRPPLLPNMHLVGPFVAFWADVGEGWRIYALGAYPIY